MIRRKLKSGMQLGSGPLMRRVIAGTILFGAATVFAFARNQGDAVWFELGANILAACVALIVLHFRWRMKERKAMSPEQVRDIFS